MAILSYCKNVHPGETLAEVLDVLRGPAARVRAAWRPHDRLGAGLWLPDAAARALDDDDAAARARDTLEAHGLFAYSVNAFPIGGFHAASVKREVYRPTWDDPARRDYTLAVFRALARLLPPGARGSVSTVPVSYKAFGTPDLARAGLHLAQVARASRDLEHTTGHELSLALEPEPLAWLETTAETIAFLEDHVFCAATVEASGVPEAELRRRVGICVDTCHLACAYEDLTASLRALDRAGVRVVKAQLSSALEVRDPAHNLAGLQRLAAFTEPRYLHQTAGRTPQGDVVAVEDLPLAVDARGVLSEALRGCTTLRTHFHVPLGWTGSDGLGTTRPDLEAGLAALAAATDHLEVETYTFDVLPPADRARYDGDVVHMIVDELRWAEAALAEVAS